MLIHRLTLKLIPTLIPNLISKLTPRLIPKLIFKLTLIGYIIIMLPRS